MKLLLVLRNSLRGLALGLRVGALRTVSGSVRVPVGQWRELRVLGTRHSVCQKEVTRSRGLSLLFCPQSVSSLFPSLPFLIERHFK